MININQVLLDEILGFIRLRTNIFIPIGDVSDVEFIQSCIEQIDQKKSGLDFAFNNAGIANPVKSIADLFITTHP